MADNAVNANQGWNHLHFLLNSPSGKLHAYEFCLEWMTISSTQS
jgi:hypothetical protein